ncbi:MAG: helix-turn-helix domain-containing protein [Pseudomonadota bacterium]
MPLQARYDTAEVRPSERFAFWKESVCESYVQLGCEAENTQQFRGSIDIDRHSVLAVSNVTGLSHSVTRRKSDIRKSSDEFFLLSVQTRKSSRLTQMGKEAILRPGDMALYMSSEAYKLELTDDFSQTVLQLPAARLSERLPNAPMSLAQRIDGQTEMGRVVRESILSIAPQLQTANSTVAALLQETLIDLVATGVATNAACTPELSSPEQHILLRAKSYIRQHLCDPELDRNVLADHLGLSVRRLSDIFNKNGTSIALYIRTCRLERVKAQLSDPRFVGQSVTEIAFAAGFSNPQSFSTLFREVYGVSPSRLRGR